MRVLVVSTYFPPHVGGVEVRGGAVGGDLGGQADGRPRGQEGRGEQVQSARPPATVRESFRDRPSAHYGRTVTV